MLNALTMDRSLLLPRDFPILCSPHVFITLLNLMQNLIFVRHRFFFSFCTTSTTVVLSIYFLDYRVNQLKPREMWKATKKNKLIVDWLKICYSEVCLFSGNILWLCKLKKVENHWSSKMVFYSMTLIHRLQDWETVCEQTVKDSFILYASDIVYGMFNYTKS